MADFRALVSSLARRDATRTEADVQAGLRELLRDERFGLEENAIRLECQAGNRLRIDIEAGFTVVEVKRDLRAGNVRAEAEPQLARYVAARTQTMGQRYVGVLTDGADWYAYHLRDDTLVEVSALTVSASQPDTDRLAVWLEGVLATKQGVRPTPVEIGRRLGVDSTSHALDQASLLTLYDANRPNPSVEMKRRLWARLLTTALGTQFEDTDALFLNHTLLVVSAKVIAHAVLNVEFATLTPAVLLGGGAFERAQISGVVEADFFGWVMEVPGGEAFVRTLARRLARFDWNDVEHDVLKVLYESVIDAETRKRLGEYYTPDWLADQVVATAIGDPLHERVLDPACGSGTFLFYAVRRHLAAAEASDVGISAALQGLSDHVIGVDLHPVAVALARVTYLLAIGRARLLHADRGPVRIPVYLGDSLQWRQRIDLLTQDHLVIPVDDRANLLAPELRFPDRLLDDVGAFDGLVADLAEAAARHTAGSPLPGLKAMYRRRGVSAGEERVIDETFALMCQLHNEGRDHIWGYYVRNLARPLWLSRPQNRVDVIVGNPPWLAFRHMSRQMQDVFRKMSESRRLWTGATVATHQDLSSLFVARSVQLYLRNGGRFAFVMPNAALDRAHFNGFRSGEFPDESEPVAVAFDMPWDLRRLRPHFFPRAAAVVFGTRRSVGEAKTMPAVAARWQGRLPTTNASWREVEPHITRGADALHVVSEGFASPYRSRFAQGATLVPRMLIMVEEQKRGPLGRAAGERYVRSARSAGEKTPWKLLEPLEGVVETRFVRDALLGENVLPFRLLPARQCVVPWDGTQLLTGSDERIEGYPRFAAWWRDAEVIWNSNRSSERLTLVEQVDYRHKLRDQFTQASQRVVYGKSGMHVAAARVTNPQAVIDHSLYWATASSEDEAHYLCAILNSAVTTRVVRPLLSYGKDERDIHKFVWQLPIPQWDARDPVHSELAVLGGRMEAEVASLQIDERRGFVALRRGIRKHLAASPVGKSIDALVSRMLGVDQNGVE